jgi:hypothetical protein
LVAAGPVQIWVLTGSSPTIDSVPFVVVCRFRATNYTRGEKTTERDLLKIFEIGKSKVHFFIFFYFSGTRN